MPFFWKGNDMADQEKNKQMQIDEMLDSLLAAYSSVEPRPGLETRILANLRNGESRAVSPGWWNFKWLWAGAVVTAIIVAAVLMSGRRHVAQPTKTVVQSGQPVPRQPVVQSSSTAAATAISRRRKTFVEPRQQNATLALSERPAIFPTPVPLSEQERLMFSYLESTPREVVIAQIPRNDDQQESEAFWADREPSSGTRRSTTTR